MEFDNLLLWTTRMTVSLNFWFEPTWQKESKHKGEDPDDHEDVMKAETPNEVEELILKRDIEMMIADAASPAKVCYRVIL